MAPPGKSGAAWAILRTARPKQWVKNLLVFAAPGAAGALGNHGVLGHTLIALAAFNLAASGTYFINDALDIEADRAHPYKCRRPIAAGELSVPVAVAIGAAAMAASIAIPLAAGLSQLAIVLGIYLGITCAYTLWLKHEPILDISAVAAGFVLRAIAGGVAAGVPLSNWFLIVASAGSMLMVSGKRHAESVNLGDSAGEHRATLDAYTLTFLRYVRSVSSGVALTAYFLWAFERAGSSACPTLSPTCPRIATGHSAIWFELSTVPFALAILRYAFLLDAGKGGAPEDVVLGDRTLQVFGVALVALFAIGLHIA